MIVYRKSKNPCVKNAITRWHASHGWLYNAYRLPENRSVGVFYATLLCGDGAVIHFDVAPGADLSAPEILHGVRSAIRMIGRASLNVIYTTIPGDRTGLIKLMTRFGFREVPDGGFLRDGLPVVLLKMDPDVPSGNI